MSKVRWVVSYAFCSKFHTLSSSAKISKIGCDLTKLGSLKVETFFETQCRVIAVSCGLKISAVHLLVLSQYTRLTDGRTDRQTELRKQYRALHYLQSHGKNPQLTFKTSTTVKNVITVSMQVTHNHDKIINILHHELPL